MGNNNRKQFVVFFPLKVQFTYRPLSWLRSNEVDPPCSYIKKNQTKQKNKL